MPRKKKCRADVMCKISAKCQGLSDRVPGQTQTFHGFLSDWLLIRHGNHVTGASVSDIISQTCRHRGYQMNIKVETYLLLNFAIRINHQSSYLNLKMSWYKAKYDFLSCLVPVKKQPS